MSARLAVPDLLPDERIAGLWAATLRLEVDPVSRIEVETDARHPPVSIPCTLWDRLFAELSLVLAHGRATPAAAGMLPGCALQ
jgi:hypothetical protein